MLKLEPLYYLYLVNNFKSIKLAAEAIHITPGAISKSLHKWQEEIGIPLLVQSYRRVELTHFAKEIVKNTESIIKELYLIEELIETQKDSLNSVVTAKPPYLTLYTANSFYQTDLENIWNYFESFGLSVTVPDVSLDCVQCLQYVNDDPNSFLINYFFDAPEHYLQVTPNVEYIKIVDVKPYVQYAEKLELSHKAENFILPEELIKHKIIVYDKGVDFVLPFCEKLKEDKKILDLFFTSSLSALHAMVKKGEGCTISNEVSLRFLSNVRNYVLSKNYSKVLIKTETDISLYLCYHKKLNENVKNILKKIAIDIVQ